MTKVAAYLGIPGSFSYAAAQELGEPYMDYLGVPSFAAVFGAVDGGEADQGVVPIENNLAGSIYDNYDLLDRYDVHVTGEHILPVEHFLLGTEAGIALDSITKVYSHPKALEQCTGLLSAYPQMERCPVSDTAAAAKLVGEQRDPTVAAISSNVAGELYGLQVLKPRVEDDPGNYTRFLRIAREAGVLEDADKCSVILRMLHEPGSLHRTLGVLATTACDLTKIESRPLVHGIPGTEHPRKTEYVFYLDFTYDQATVPVSAIVQQLKSVVAQAKILGTYKRSEPPVI